MGGDHRPQMILLNLITFSGFNAIANLGQMQYLYLMPHTDIHQVRSDKVLLQGLILPTHLTPSLPVVLRLCLFPNNFHFQNLFVQMPGKEKKKKNSCLQLLTKLIQANYMICYIVPLTIYNQSKMIQVLIFKREIFRKNYQSISSRHFSQVKENSLN